MKTTAIRSSLACCAVLLSLSTLSTTASARDRSTSFSGPQGQTMTRNVSRAQGDVSSSTTGPGRPKTCG